MASWRNPASRRIDGRNYHLYGQGMSKASARSHATKLRNKGEFARVFPDVRPGRYDVRNHDIFYCVYSSKKVSKVIDGFPGGGKYDPEARE